MLLITDLLTDDADDIVISDDIELDQTIDSTIKTAERRLVSRYDDYFLNNTISSGLERFIFQTQTPFTIENIRKAIIDSLLEDNLFVQSDFILDIPYDNKSRKLPITIKFKYNIGSNNLFKIIVDIENQRIYRN